MFLLVHCFFLLLLFRLEVFWAQLWDPWSGPWCCQEMTFAQRSIAPRHSREHNRVCVDCGSNIFTFWDSNLLVGLLRDYIWADFRGGSTRPRHFLASTIRVCKCREVGSLWPVDYDHTLQSGVLSCRFWYKICRPMSSCDLVLSRSTFPLETT